MRRLSYSGKLFREFVGFARANRAYWIIPLVIVLGLASFMIVTSQVVAPYLHDHTALTFARAMAGVVGGYEPPPGA